jgi:hypothetical protein
VVWMDRPRTEAPQTQIYFITHESGAFLVLRLRSVVCGERASRSIVNNTTAARFLGVVESLILAGLGLVTVFIQTWGREVSEPRGEYGVHDTAQ